MIAATPALVVDLERLEANIAAMAGRSRASGVALRPHVKTHKCSTLAARQLEAGAAGLSCATIDEAEAMAHAGLRNLLLTSPVVGEERIARLVALAWRDARTIAVVDHPDNVDAIAQAAATAGLRLGLLVDFDVRQQRTGVASIEAGIALARRIRERSSLELRGMQAYAGHLQHVVDRAERSRLADAAKTTVARARDALVAIGVTEPIVSGSGTGTHDIDSRETPFTELQVGSYVFMDEDYGRVAAADPQPWPFSAALFVRTTVVSVNVAGFATTDAGTKAFALNGPPPRVVTAPWAGAAYSFAGDEHGRLALAAGMPVPPLGAVLECVVSHVDPTVCLYDRFYCRRGGRLVETWRVDARERR
jgi:D-serine deaminase-like pyridoxal phosphate-dependent protein